MVGVVLGAVLALQQLHVTARVDRNAVMLGDEVVLTITIESIATVPIEIRNPDVAGLEVLSSRDASSVTVRDGEPARVTTREITLRPVRAGTVTIGPALVRRGDEIAETAPLRITVSTPSAGATGGLAPRVRALLEGTPAPRITGDEVALTVLPSAESILLGDQVDLVVVAWFPRAVRSRLRNPPTLEMPAVRGAWAYHRPAPSGIAHSRNVRGVWYDLFVQHEVIFPLAAGDLEIGPASLTYSRPLTYSFLSRELRYEVRSEPRIIHVEQQPDPQELYGFSGAAGRDLTLQVEVSATELPLGGAVRVRVELKGRGNLSLWPEPEIAWPEELRAYAEEVEIKLDSEDDLIGGTKAFYYLVVADSIGTHHVPTPRYVYFDLGQRSHVELRAAPLEFVTASDTHASTPLRAGPPPLMAVGTLLSLNALLAALPLWAWVLIGAFPPVVVLLKPLIRIERHRSRKRQPRRRRPRGPLQQLDWEFRNILEQLVPQAGLRDGDGLADALRAAGVEAPVAAHAARVRDRLRQALFGPKGATDPDELAAEVQEVLRAMVGRSHGAARTAAVGSLVVVLSLGVATGLAGQSPERLYQAGAVRAAADSFVARTVASPLEPAHWHNLGNAFHQLGEESRARVAWLHAARLAPRRSAVRRALASSPAPDRISARLTWVAPLTPAEAVFLGFGLWIVGWILVAVRTRIRAAALLVVIAAVVMLYSGYVARLYARPVALVVTPDAPLRPAPYGSAPARRTLGKGVAVVVEQELGPWVRVRRVDERGWLLRTEVAPL